MLVNDIINAKEALTKLNTIKFSDFAISYKIYKLIKSVNEVLDSVQAEQNKIKEKYVAKDATGKFKIENNQYQFFSEKDKTNFINEINKLKTSDIDSINKIQIPAHSVQYASALSSADMMILDIFIDWVD